MLLRHPFSPIVAIAISPIYCVSAFIPMHEFDPAFPRTQQLWVMALAMLPAGAFFAYTLPRLRARWFFSNAGYPHHAFLLPRWMICLVSTTLLGASFGLLVAASLGASDTFTMACLQLTCWISFAYSASIRCSLPSGCEFAVPWRPRSLLRWK